MLRTFAQYIEAATKAVRAVRSRFYQGDKLEQVIEMSVPFEQKRTPKPKKGVLLVHGFLSSPYLMRSLADDFVKEDFLVRAVLLPGHGTDYQELDHYTWQDWLATVRFGYETLVQECEEIYLCGFSIGATLSLLLVLELLAQGKHHKLKKLILLAPCFGITPFAKIFPFLIKTHLSKILPQLFCTQAETEHLGSYKQFSLYSVSQIVEMLSALKQALLPYRNQHLPLPTYVIAAREDATVKFAPINYFVASYLNEHSFFYVYSNKSLILPKTVPNLLIPSNRLNNNILGMSHVAIPVIGTDSYFGNNGSYYGVLPANTRFGEPLHFKYRIKRLTYNPDYAHLQKHLFTWLGE
jgi:esterase/lipase